MSVCVRLAPQSDLEACFEIRRVVFVHEQGVSRDEEFDELDDVCVHFIARFDGRPVGTARLRVLESEGKAQRVAVLEEARRSGIGAALMRALEAEASRRGLARIVLHAQTSAMSFYEALGYVAEGDEFMEADIPHFLMRKPLP